MLDLAGVYLDVVPLKAVTTLTGAVGTQELSARQGADLVMQNIPPIVSDMHLGQPMQRFMVHGSESLPAIKSTVYPFMMMGMVAKSPSARALSMYVCVSVNDPARHEGV